MELFDSLQRQDEAEELRKKLRLAMSTLEFIATSKFQFPPETLINEAAKAVYVIGPVPR